MTYPDDRSLLQLMVMNGSVGLLFAASSFAAVTAVLILGVLAGGVALGTQSGMATQPSETAEMPRL